jgi:hypothetical protein
MTDTPTSSSKPDKWSNAAVLVLAALTAFMTAYREFGAPDAKQDAAIAALVRLSCYENDRRERLCKIEGLIK